MAKASIKVAECGADPGQRITPAQREVFVQNHAWNQANYGRSRADSRVVAALGRRRAPREHVDPIALAIGEQVKFFGDRRWWQVRALSEGYVVLTRSGDFGGDPLYTIIAWNEGRRGPHGNYGYDAVTDDDCVVLARALAGDPPADREVPEMSERRSIRLDLAAIRAGSEHEQVKA